MYLTTTQTLTQLEDSCIEVVADCMDPDAYNYNELANTPDEESCLYDAGCITGPASLLA